MKKKCFKCKRIRLLDQFYPHKQMKDGHLNKCKSCTKRDIKERYDNPITRERIREYERMRFKTPERKIKVLEYQRNRRKNFPGKYKARQEAGKLEKKPCELCGNEKGQAHHTDYRKHITVKWLCFKHHREAHGQKVGVLI